MTTSEISGEAVEMAKTLNDYQKKFLVDSLNVHGSFFHKKCIEVISESQTSQGWIVRDKEVLSHYAGRDTRIDIVAERGGSSSVLILPIECKKADRNFKTWVFFPEKKCGFNDKSVVTERDGRIPIMVDVIGFTGHSPPGIQHMRMPFYPKDNRGQNIPHKVCYDGFEILMSKNSQGKLNMNNITKSKKNSIEEVCIQVLTGSRGYITQGISKLKKTIKESDSIPPHCLRKIIHLPVIVTTAHLYTCEVQPSDISLTRGVTKSHREVSLNEEKWIVLNYKPSFMLAESVVVEPSIKTWDTPLEYVLGVFIVNAAHFEEFLEKVKWSV